MPAKKKHRMAFRPCADHAFLEDRLVLSVPATIEPIAAHAAELRSLAGMAPPATSSITPSTISASQSTVQSSQHSTGIGTTGAGSGLSDSGAGLAGL